MLFEKQQYQQDCVNSILSALDDIDLTAVDVKRLQDNIRRLKDANVPTTHPLRPKPRLDVLMETGTRKTFTYLQTILELHKQHSHAKFVIVLPRAAIKQAVIQNIRLTDQYFYDLYRRHIRWIDYPQAGLAAVQQDFIYSRDLCVLITTNSAFNSEANKINKRLETLAHVSSIWEGIAAEKPVVIIDEPHLLKGAQTAKGLDLLGDCLRVRFGATYPPGPDSGLSNVVYALDSISAFNQCLVKRIGVNTLYFAGGTSGLAVQNVAAREGRFEVVYQLNGQPHKRTVRRGDDLGAATGLAEYRGRSVTRVAVKQVSLSDRTVLPRPAAVIS